MNEKFRRVPFWIRFGLSPATIVYVGALAVLAGVIVGVVPALKATGKRVLAGLQQFSARGSGLQLGRTWTTLIVLQVAIAVAVLPGAIHYVQESIRTGTQKPPEVANRLLHATLALANQADAQAAIARLAQRTATLKERLEADPQVAAVTFAQRFAGAEPYVPIETEDSGTRDARFRAQMNRVAINFFDVFGVSLLAGRGFTAADTTKGATAVIVDQLFADKIGGGNVLGRRVRLSVPQRDGEREVGPWLEIVGVVPPFAHQYANPSGIAALGPARRGLAVQSTEALRDE